MRNRLRNLLEKVKRSIVDFNLFDKYSRYPYRIRCGRIATRLYVILLTCAISIVIVYTCLAVQKITKTIDWPLQEQYEEFEHRYPSTLHCPCTNISIHYEEFIQVTPMYHQLCESDFVQPWWYKSLSPVSLIMDPVLFNFAAASRFQILATLCEIANLTATDARRSLSSTSFVNAQIIPRRLFVSQTNSIINTFLNSTRFAFKNTMLLINAVLQANQYISGIGSDTDMLRTMYFPQLNLSGLDLVSVTSSSFTIVGENGEKCYCARNAKCNKKPSPAAHYMFWIGVGTRIGCSTMDSVLISSLECWYDNSCTNSFIQYYNFVVGFVPTNVTLLDVTRRSQFPPNSSVQSIVDEMMVEQWNSSASYASFYQKCHPAFCSYTYENRIDVVYIVTTVIGLFGGLTIILRLISLAVVKIFFKCTNRATPDNQLQAPSNRETTDRE
jgi:hypothetical protein